MGQALGLSYCMCFAVCPAAEYVLVLGSGHFARTLAQTRRLGIFGFEIALSCPLADDIANHRLDRYQDNVKVEHTCYDGTIEEFAPV